MGESVSEILLAGRAVFKHRAGSLGVADYPITQPGVAWVCALRRGLAPFPGGAVDLAANCQFLYVCRGIVYGPVFLSLGNAPRSGAHPVDVECINQFVAFISGVVYYFDTSVTLIPSPFAEHPRRELP